MLYWLISVPLIFLILLRLYGLLQNYVSAKQHRLPIIILPVSQDDTWWTAIRPLFGWIEHLPAGLGQWYRYTDVGWPMTDGGETHARLGDSFVFVTPTRNMVFSKDTKVVYEIHKDARKWHMPAPYDDMFNIFGHNVASTNGADWQRHRKVTAAVFNEKTMSVVWKTSLEISSNSFISSQPVVQDMSKWRSDISVVAMRILAIWAFGQEGGVDQISPGHKMSLLEALKFIMQHIVMTIIFKGLKSLPSWILPSRMQHLSACMEEFDLYMKQQVQAQMLRSRSAVAASSEAPTLIESLLAANEAERQGGSSKTYLNDSELYGNIFLFQLAGYETTAGTFSLTLPYLAAHPEIQTWVVEEVDRYFSTSSKSPNTANRSYDSTYPQLVRCLALMYEVLRLSSPAPMMLRAPVAPTALDFSNGHSIKLTPNDMVCSEQYVQHLDSTWGPDAKSFNPQRFITTTTENAGRQKEQFGIPQGVIYMAWLHGPRVCPGKKFSQVEFVAVIAVILSRFKLELVKEDGESDEGAQKRVIEELKRIYFNISAHLKKPQAISLRFVPRE